MLTDFEKEKILSEESYRAEIRSKFASKERGGIFKFLNSALGIWLLSAIFVTGAGSSWTHYNEIRSAEIDRLNNIAKLDSEIGFRFSQHQIQLYLVFSENKSKKNRELSVKDLVLRLIHPAIADSPYLYPEYKNYSVPALIVELKKNVEFEVEKRELDSVLADITGGKIFFESADIDISNVKLVAGYTIEKIVLDRWKNNGWYFIDGNMNNPFI